MTRAHTRALLLLLVSLSALSCRGPERSAVPQGAPREAVREARACDRGDERACTNLGLAWLDGSLGHVDRAHAEALLRRACAAGAHLACVPLADLIEPAEALTVLRQACAAGAHVPCLGLGRMLEDEEGYSALGLACEGRILEACYLRGMRLRAGEGVPPDRGAGRDALRRACSSGSMPACRELARIVADEEGDAEVAHTLALGACRGGDGEGCAMAAAHLRAADGAEDRASARIFEERACELGYAEACEGAGAPE